MADDVHEPPGVISDGQSFDEDQDLGHADYLQGLQYITDATKHDTIKEGYTLLLKAANDGHRDAMDLIARAYLFGQHASIKTDKAVKWARKLADTGHPGGHVLLGFMHSVGVGVPMDQAKAITHYMAAALSRHPYALMALAHKYRMGQGMPKYCENAETLYAIVASEVAADIQESGGYIAQRQRLGSDEGSESLGYLQNYLVEYYQYNADRGDAMAQAIAGRLYYHGGHGVQRNYTKALSYFKKAAANGNYLAHGYLGNVYMKGKGADVDYDKAVKHFRVAAEKGNPIGQNGLGYAYLHGYGVKKDYKEAYRWFEKAQKNADGMDGLYNLGFMHYHGLGTPQDHRRALRAFTLAAERDHTLALYNAAMMQHEGKGTGRSCQHATTLFKAVAERGKWNVMLEDAHTLFHENKLDKSLMRYLYLAETGFELAISNAAYVLDYIAKRYPDGDTSWTKEGIFSEANRLYPLALVYWERAAAQNNNQARVKIGDYHYFGKGTPVSYERALHHYRLASQQHIAQAYFNLAYMYENGEGVDQDFDLAERNYDSALEADSKVAVPVGLALAKLRARVAFAHAWDTTNNINIGDVGATITKRAGELVDLELALVGLLLVLLMLLVKLRERLYRT